MFRKGVRHPAILVAIFTIFLIDQVVISQDTDTDPPESAPNPAAATPDTAPNPAAATPETAPNPAAATPETTPKPSGTTSAAGAGADVPIPEDVAGIESWFTANVKPYAERKADIDPALAAAEAEPRTVKVRQDGSGDFKTVNEAVASIPKNNAKRVIVWIGPGNYQEKVMIEATQHFVTFYGEANAMPNLTFGDTARTHGTFNSSTLIVLSDYFMGVNIVVKNSAPKPDGKMEGNQAVAARFSGQKAALYNCKFFGYQDTLCDDIGKHFFKDCYVQGIVDFIFGNGKSLYLNMDINVVADANNYTTIITAQGRQSEDEDSGFSFVHGKISGEANGTYLGRPWRSHPRVVYAYTHMGEEIHDSGWDDRGKPERQETAFYGEYKCSGPGSDPQGRVKFIKQLTEQEVKPYLNLGYIEGSKWLLPPPKL